MITTQETCDIKNKVATNGWVQAGKLNDKGAVWGPNRNPPPATYGQKPGVPDVWPTADNLTSYYGSAVISGDATKMMGTVAAGERDSRRKRHMSPEISYKRKVR